MQYNLKTVLLGQPSSRNPNQHAEISAGLLLLASVVL